MFIGVILFVFAILGALALGFLAYEHYPRVFHYFGLGKAVWIENKDDHELKVHLTKKHPDGKEYVIAGKYTKRMIKLLDNGQTDNSYYTWYEYKGPKL